jgi:hypothetical protein
MTIMQNDSISYRKVPVSVYTYRLTGQRWAVIQSEEDERQVDILDAFSWTASTPDLNYWRCSFYPITGQKDLPLYAHYLDELSISTTDLKELIKVMSIIEYRLTTAVLSVREFEEEIGVFPDTNAISWEIFNDLFVFEQV